MVDQFIANEEFLSVLLVEHNEKIKVEISLKSKSNFTLKHAESLLQIDLFVFSLLFRFLKKTG